jgi:hypothetical protein
LTSTQVRHGEVLVQQQDRRRKEDGEISLCGVSHVARVEGTPERSGRVDLRVRGGTNRTLIEHLKALKLWIEGDDFEGRDYDTRSKNYTDIHNAPSEMTLVAVLGFGYPAKKRIGKKNRLPLDQIAFHEKYGESISKL